MPGGSVNLTCVAVGSPMPYVKWMTGQVELTKEEEMPLGRNVLEVTNIRESANYSCVAISSLGMIEATAQVTVKGKTPRSPLGKLLPRRTVLPGGSFGCTRSSLPEGRGLLICRGQRSLCH